MQTDFDLNFRFDAGGVFWEPAAPEAKFSGHISTSGKHIDFVTAARLEELDLRKALSSWGSPPERIDVLHGISSYGPVSLIGLQGSGDPGFHDATTGRSLSARSFRVSACLAGIQLARSEEAVFTAASVSYRGLRGWFASAGEVSVTDKTVSINFPRGGFSVVDVCVLGLRVRVSISVAPSVGYGLGGPYMSKPDPLVTIESCEPRSLDWFFNAAVRFENLFSLCLGSSVGVSAIKLTSIAGQCGWLVSPRKSYAGKPDITAWVRCEASHVASAIASWLSVPVEDQPFESLIYGTIRRSSMFVEAEFLALAQALESFHRVTERQLGDVPFRSRIEGLMSKLSAGHLKDLLGEAAIFEQRVRETRNYFTHPGIERKDNVVTSAYDLFMLNQRLHALLRLLMLTKVGIPEDVAFEPVITRLRKWL